MHYCFVKQDICSLESHDPLLLQYKYAETIGKSLLMDLDTCQITGNFSDVEECSGENVLLRATCTSVVKALDILDSLKINTIENRTDIQQIEHWDKLNLTQRKIYSRKVDQIISGDIDNELYVFLCATEKCFVKSRKKGFCLCISADKILSGNAEWIDFLNSNTDISNDDILISGYYEIKKDSLGNRETRHIVINGQRINSSRSIHSLKHAVMPSHIEKAEKIIADINGIPGFPQNYIIDLGEFIYDGVKVIDIVEFNPISLGMCYVNNSIFIDRPGNIEEEYQRRGIGYEFCLDAIENPELYPMHRVSAEIYQYRNDSFYFL